MCSPMSLSVLKHQGGFFNAALLVFSCILLFLTVERLQTPSLSVLFFMFLRQTLHSSSHLNEVVSLNTLNGTTWVNDLPLACVIPVEPQILRLQPAAGGNQRWFWLWPRRRLAAIISSMFLDEFLYQSLTELPDLLKVFSLSVPAVTHRTELQLVCGCARQHMHW